jgi:SP family general alpha glucoside:H+ symporter-like MFS transporter
MRRVIELEKSVSAPTYLELFRGTDLRRTIIVCCVYAGQNLAGNLIANQAVYFFERTSYHPLWEKFVLTFVLTFAEAGIKTNLAFALGLITSALQMIFVMLSWFLTTYFGRRTLYLWGTGVNVVLLVALGVAASVGTSTQATLAQASLGLIISVLFTFAAAPVSWCVIAETSAIRLRPLTTGIGRATYYIIEIPCIFRESTILNPLG